MPAADRLSRLLAERDWLLADGATGTTLLDMGLEPGEAPELWNLTEPDRVRALHDGMIAAGAGLVLTNSFGGTAARLAAHDAEGDAPALNRAAAAIARAAADRAGHPVAVAGSIGPIGSVVGDGGLDRAEAEALFAEQARALAEGGVDVLWVETLSSPAELQAAAAAIAALGLPWCCTMSFDGDGRTAGGLTAAATLALVEGLAHPPLAFGANCGMGASDLVATLVDLAAAGPRLPVVAKANAGMPRRTGGAIVYDGTPALMADYAVLARDCGARIIGGCCGTLPAHLAAMRRALETTPQGARPDLATIAARLGPFAAPARAKA